MSTISVPPQLLLERILTLEIVRVTERAAVSAARLTNPAVKAVGLALNTSNVAANLAQDACKKVSDRLGLPCEDPLTMGVESIVDNLLSCFAA